jgi:two-component system, NtrC family, sensor kinase
MIASYPPDAVGASSADRRIPFSPAKALDPLSRSLAAGLAHHVNNPLLGVIGSLELALRETQSEGMLHDRLQRSLTCALFAAEAVRRLVAYAFHPGGGQDYVSLADAATRAARRLHDQGNGEGLLIRMEGESLARAHVSVPVLELVMAQLLANAREALPGGGTVTLRVWDGPGVCGLSIQDDGPGLSPAARTRLFEPFFSTKGYGHLGLGLVLCRDLIESQGGRLEVASPPGEGVRVTVTLSSVTETEDTNRSVLGAPHWTANGLVLRT